MNEYAPVFKEKSYKATVVEGKQYDSILRVEAVDADCSPQFSQICSYEIVTPDVPFAIDKDGKSEEQTFLTGETVRGQVCTWVKLKDLDDLRPSLQAALESTPSWGLIRQTLALSHGSGGWETTIVALADPGSPEA